MGRQGQGGGEPTVHHSSIALLQERFRRLERVKEERELMRLMAAAQSGRSSASLLLASPRYPRDQKPAGWFLSTDSISHQYPSTASLHHGPSACKPFRTFTSQGGGLSSITTTTTVCQAAASDTSVVSVGLWAADRTTAATRHGHSYILVDEAEVDTSLHL